MQEEKRLICQWGKFIDVKSVSVVTSKGIHFEMRVLKMKTEYYLRKFKNSSFVTIGFVIINVLIFIYGTKINRGIYENWMLDLQKVLQDHEYYRAITSVFLHQEISHIFNNMIILFFLGDMLEKEIGHLPFGIIYILSGIAGSAASLYYKMIHGVINPSLGASGAIFGLDGLLLAIVILNADRMRNVSLQRTILMIVLSVYSGYTGQNIDNAAHVGGLLGGFVLGALYCMLWSNHQNPYNRGGRL